MSVQKMDSVGHYATANLLNMGKYNVGAGTVNATGSPTGGPRITLAGGNYVTAPLVTNASSGVVGVRFRVSTLIAGGTCILGVHEAGAAVAHARLDVSDSGILSLVRGDGVRSMMQAYGGYGTILQSTAAGLIAPNTWYDLVWAWVVNDSVAGGACAWLNEALVLTLGAGQDTRAGGTGICDCWGVVAFGGNVVDFCDLWAGDANLGDCRVDPQFPTANGSDRDWALSTGSDEYALLDDPTANTTDYIKTSTVGARTSIQKEVLRNTGGTVKAVQGNCYCTKSDAGPCGLKMYLLIGGTRYYGDEFFPSFYSWLGFPFAWSLNPSAGTPPWDEAAVNAAELGVERTT